MGGTSTDVCLVRGGVPEPAADAAGWRASRCGCPRWRCTPSAPAAVRSPGSTRAARSSWGPRARARIRGPRATGAAASEATVTDADLVLGRIPPRHGAAGLRPPRRARGAAALARAGVTADGVVAVVDAAMERAVRVVTVEQGDRPPRPRAGRVRGCRSAPCVRRRRTVGHADGHRTGAGRGVLGGRAARARPSSGRWCAPGRRPAHARRPRRRPAARLGGRGRRARSPMVTSRVGSTAGTRARATSSRVREVERVRRPSTSDATASRAPARRSRSSRCGRGSTRRRAAHGRRPAAQ